MLNVVMCGGMRSSIDADAAPRRHRHAEHVLGFHIARAGTVRYGSASVDIRGPFIALLPAGEADVNGMTGEVDCRWCLFHSAAVSGDGRLVSVRWAGTLVRRPHVRWLAPAEVRQARDRMNRLAALHARPGGADQLAAAALLMELLSLWASPGRQHGGDDPVAAFRDAIEERADDPTCSLDQLARASGLHPDWIRRRFHAVYGLTPIAYRLRLRLTRARDILQTSAMPVAEAGRLVGFANPSQFTRMFRRHFGVRPSELVRLGRAT